MVWPDEAGIGAQPARRAKAASLLIRPWCDQEMTSCACKAQKLRFACAESFRPYDRLVFFFLIHLAVRRLLRVMARGSSVAALEVENAVLRHELAVLRRNGRRRPLRRRDRLLLAAASAVLPRERWSGSRPSSWCTRLSASSSPDVRAWSGLVHLLWRGGGHDRGRWIARVDGSQAVSAAPVASICSSRA